MIRRSSSREGHGRRKLCNDGISDDEWLSLMDDITKNNRKAVKTKMYKQRTTAQQTQASLSDPRLDSLLTQTTSSTSPSTSRADDEIHDEEFADEDVTRWLLLLPRGCQRRGSCRRGSRRRGCRRRVDAVRGMHVRSQTNSKSRYVGRLVGRYHRSPSYFVCDYINSHRL